MAKEIDDIRDILDQENNKKGSVEQTNSSLNWKVVVILFLVLAIVVTFF